MTNDEAKELVDDSNVPDDDAVPENEVEAFEQVGEVPGTHLRAADFWDDVVADMKATAKEYEADGWETVQLHPGDVTTLTPGQDDRFGLDVLVPGDEFERVEELLDDGVTFDAYEAFRAMADGLVLFVVAMQDHDAEVAVLYPAYYDAQNAQAMLGAARDAGEMRSYVRTLTDDEIEFTHEEPENFAPPLDDEE